MSETAVDNAKYRRLRANGVPHAQAVAMAAVTPTVDFSPPSSLATDLELSSALAVKAPLASPAFTGTPTKNGSPVQSQADVVGAYVATADGTSFTWNGNPISLGGASLTPTAVKTSAYTAAAGDLVPVDTTSGAVTVTLPTAPADKTQVVVKHVTQGGTNAVTVACGGSAVINKAGGATSMTLPLLAQAVILQYKASSSIWYVLADDLPLSQLDLRHAAIVETVNTVAASGSAVILPDVTTASVHDVTLTAATVALTFPSAGAGKSFMLCLRQDATGGRLVTWPASVVWPSGNAPVLTTAVSKRDLISFISISGTNWVGLVAGQNVA